MSICKKCHVEILDETDICPLCNCVVEREEEIKKKDNYYPDIAMKQQKLRLAMRIYLFVAVLVEAALFTITYLEYDPFFWHHQTYIWCLLFAGLLAFGYLALSWFMHGSKTSYALDIMFWLVALVCFVDLGDSLFGSKGHGMNYIQPSIFVAANLLILFLIIFNKRTWQTFIYMQVGVLILSLLAIPLIRAGQVTDPLVSVIAIIWSVVQTFGFLVIGGPRVKEELVRRFHIN